MFIVVIGGDQKPSDAPILMPMPADQLSLEGSRALLQVRHEHVIKLEPLGLVQRHDFDGMNSIRRLQSGCCYFTL